MSAEPHAAKFVFLGDVMLGRGVDEVLHKATPSSVWGTTIDIIRSADFSLINLECALTYHEKIWTETPKAFYFKANPKLATEALKAAHISCVSLANNHTLDFREEGLIDTLRYLDKAGICRVGAGRSPAEARSPIFAHVGNITVGIIAFTDNQPDFAARNGKPGVSYAPIQPDSDELRLIEVSTKEAKEVADLVVISAHWGPNMLFHPPHAFREVAHILVDAGADVIHGHSAHNFQGIDIYKGKPVIYSSGNFIDDYAIDPVYRNDQSFIFVLNLRDAVMDSIDLYPVHLSYARTDLAVESEFIEIANRMEKLSGELGTNIIRRGDKLEILLPVEETRRAA